MRNIREELKEISLSHDNNGWYLDMVYEYENEHGVYEIHIPHLNIPIYDDRMPVLELACGFNNECYALFGGIKLPLTEAKTKHGKNGKYHYTIKTLKEKRQEMTLEEIEKKLGYKIKIVSEKE